MQEAEKGAPPGGLPASENALGRENYLSHGHGLRSWLLTLDHKRIALMYLVSILASFFLGGIFALLIRTELLTPSAPSWTPTPTTRCSPCTAR